MVVTKIERAKLGPVEKYEDVVVVEGLDYEYYVVSDVLYVRHCVKMSRGRKKAVV